MIYCLTCKRTCVYESRDRLVSCDGVVFDEKTQAASRVAGEANSCVWTSNAPK